MNNKIENLEVSYNPTMGSQGVSYGPVTGLADDLTEYMNRSTSAAAEYFTRRKVESELYKIYEAAENNPILHKMLDDVIVYYKLITPEEDNNVKP